MKTAIQELFSQLEIEHPNLFNTNTLEGRKFVNDYYKFFELEKQHIIDACYFAYNEGCAYMSGSTTKYESFEQYYEETFNK